MYSAQLLDHFQNPRNAGDVADADAIAEIENPACGDVLRLSLKMNSGRIAEIRFKAKGCVPSMACASALDGTGGGADSGRNSIPAPRNVDRCGGRPAAGFDPRRPTGFGHACRGAAPSQTLDSAMPGSHHPRRIACLQPSATVILDAVGELGRVVACTRYCADVVPEVC